MSGKAVISLKQCKSFLVLAHCKGALKERWLQNVRPRSAPPSEVRAPNCLVSNRFLSHKRSQPSDASAASGELQKEETSVLFSGYGVWRLQCLILLCSRALKACYALCHLGCQVPVTVTISPFCWPIYILTSNNCLFVFNVMDGTKAEYKAE